MNCKPQVEYVEAGGQASITLFAPNADGYVKDSLTVCLDEAGAESKVREFFAHNQLNKNTVFELIYLSDRSFSSSLVLPKVSRGKAKQLLEKDLTDKLGPEALETVHLEFVTADYGQDGLYCLALMARNEGIVKAKEALSSLGIKTKAINFYPLLEALALTETGIAQPNPIIISPHGNAYVVDFYQGHRLVDSLLTPKSPYLYSEIMQVAGRQQYGFAKADFDCLIYLGGDGKELIEKDDPTHLPHFTLNKATRFYSPFKRLLFRLGLIKSKAMKKTKGFSLLEVVVSLAVLGIAIGGTTGVVLGMNSLNRASLRSQQASDYLTEIGERFESSDDLSYVLNYPSWADQEQGYVELTDGRFLAQKEESERTLFTVEFALQGETGHTSLIIDLYDGGHIYAENLVYEALR